MPSSQMITSTDFWIIFGIVLFTILLIAGIVNLCFHLFKEKKLDQRITKYLLADMKGEAVKDSDKLFQLKKKRRFVLSKKQIALWATIVFGLLALESYRRGLDNLLIVTIVLYFTVLAVLFAMNLYHIKKKREFVNIFPQVVDYLTQVIAGGRTITEALNLAAGKYTGMVGTTLNNITKAISVGTPYVTAVRLEAYRVNIAEFYFFSVLLITQHKSGGKIIKALSSLADKLNQNRAMELKIRALAAQSKSQIWILIILPWALLGLMILIMPDTYMLLITEPTGKKIIMGCIIAELLALAIMKNLTNVEVS